MKTKLHVLIFGLLLAGLLLGAYNQAGSQSGRANDKVAGTDRMILQLEKKAPVDANKYMPANEMLSTTLWADDNMQVTSQLIPVGSEVGLDVHPYIDQYFRIDEGEGEVQMGDARDKLTFAQPVSADFSIYVPAGKWYNIINTGNRPLKLYSVLALTEYSQGTVHLTYKDVLSAVLHAQ